MDYQLGKSESISAAFHRAGTEVISQIRVGASKADPEGIHEARKGCKWLRAMLRLLRSGLEADAAATEIRRIRRLAHLLGGVRDATIRLLSFRSLGLEGFDNLEKRLETDAAAEHSYHVSPKAQRKAQLAIDTLERGWTALRLKRGGWRHIGRGIERSYCRARKGFCSLGKNPADEHLHEWRKRAKDLMYHVRLLEPSKPKKVSRIENQLSDLCDWLGYDHDLIILTAYLRKDRQLSEADHETLICEVGKRRKEHQTAARHVAEIIFKDTPTEFSQKLERWWDGWRG
jgi:CHAD domain-containing protein